MSTYKITAPSSVTDVYCRSDAAMFHGAVNDGGPAAAESLTAVRAHVDLQGAGAGAALPAVGEGADALIGVRVFGLVLGGRAGRRLLPTGTVVHEVGLQVPLAAVPDPTVLTWEDIL